MQNFHNLTEGGTQGNLTLFCVSNLSYFAKPVMKLGSGKGPMQMSNNFKLLSRPATN